MSGTRAEVLPDASDVLDEHFPWHYTEFGTSCSCGRPVDRAEECEVIRRARRLGLIR